MHRKSRLFDHVVLHVKDINASKKFYRAIVETLGHSISSESHDTFSIDQLEIRQAPEVSKAVQLAFNASNVGAVRMFHETALKCGGGCLFRPENNTTPGIYKAQVTDPDGNTIQVIYKGINHNNISISY